MRHAKIVTRFQATSTFAWLQVTLVPPSATGVNDGTYIQAHANDHGDAVRSAKLQINLGTQDSPNWQDCLNSIGMPVSASKTTPYTPTYEAFSDVFNLYPGGPLATGHYRIVSEISLKGPNGTIVVANPPAIHEFFVP